MWAVRCDLRAKLKIAIMDTRQITPTVLSKQLHHQQQHQICMHGRRQNVAPLPGRRTVEEFTVAPLVCSLQQCNFSFDTYKHMNSIKWLIYLQLGLLLI
jgi:hypothetical protein